MKVFKIVIVHKPKLPKENSLEELPTEVYDKIFIFSASVELFFHKQ